MKRRASSSSKRKVAPPFRRPAVRRPAKRRVSAPRRLASAVRPAAARATVAVATGDVVPLAAERLGAAFPRPPAPPSAELRPETPPASRPTLVSDATNRRAMWAGVGVSMAFIVVGWAWAFRSTFNAAPAPLLPPDDLQRFSTLYQEVNRSLGEIQRVVPAAPGPGGQPFSPAAQASPLSPDQLERLKEKIRDAAAAPASPSSP